MGPFGGAIAAGVTVLTGIAPAGFEAARSLGEYGVRIRDVELRTGLTAKEVGQFGFAGFAARAAGQDTTIFERMMRGLSEAADDTSKEGEKARTTLQRIGVTMVDAHTGALKPTAQVLEEIAEGLNRLPAVFERDAAALALFKRAGVEAVPVIAELTENLDIARRKGYGPSEDDVKRFTGCRRRRKKGLPTRSPAGDRFAAWRAEVDDKNQPESYRPTSAMFKSGQGVCRRHVRMSCLCHAEMVQWDTSVHDWLEGRGERMYLIHMIGDTPAN
jgi:hypothetical protein